jgi:dipeptidase
MKNGSILLVHAAALLVGLAAIPSGDAAACTNFLITKAASADGSTMITYAADSHSLYGELYFWSEARHRRGTKRAIIEWDTQELVGHIDEVRDTYRVVGNMNEHQVAIGETTFGGREELVNEAGGIDYGSLIYVTLQRAKTARGAIDIMTELVARHGYKSSGESFSISDPNEVWIMEMIGMGEGRKGAVWVARRIPEGSVSAHANQARIRQFPLDDPENTLYSDNVISFAREKGYFDGPDEDFSFSDAYSPADFGARRFCDARVWSFYRRIAPSQDFSIDYVKSVRGAQPLPLWIRPDEKISLSDVMDLMRDHFEGTELDMTKGVGAGPHACPYRWRPLTWELDGRRYLNERATATQQTAFSFVSQSRSWLPDEVGGVLWFGVDDTDSTVYVPMYTGISKVPHGFAVGTGDFETFTWESAFWVFNHVSNFSYLRYNDMHQDVRRVQKQLENQFIEDQAAVDADALRGRDRCGYFCRRRLTRYTSKVADMTVRRFKRLGEELLVKYLDGNVRDEQGEVTHPPYDDDWYRRIVEESGDHFEVIEIDPVNGGPAAPEAEAETETEAEAGAETETEAEPAPEPQPADDSDADHTEPATAPPPASQG